MNRINVEKRDNESFENLLKRFKRKVKDTNIIYTAKEKRYFTKKSKRRRDAKKRAVNREKERARNYEYPSRNLYEKDNETTR